MAGAAEAALPGEGHARPGRSSAPAQAKQHAARPLAASAELPGLTIASRRAHRGLCRRWGALGVRS
eukprot:9152864-Alexandrium_andersonii.AAC.1